MVFFRLSTFLKLVPSRDNSKMINFNVFTGHPQAFVFNHRNDLLTRWLMKYTHMVAERSWCLLVITESRLEVAERTLNAAGETIQTQRLAIERLLQAQPQGNKLVDTTYLGKPPPLSSYLDSQGNPSTVCTGRSGPSCPCTWRSGLSLVASSRQAS